MLTRYNLLSSQYGYGHLSLGFARVLHMPHLMGNVNIGNTWTTVTTESTIKTNKKEQLNYCLLWRIMLNMIFINGVISVVIWWILCKDPNWYRVSVNLSKEVSTPNLIQMMVYPFWCKCLYQNSIVDWMTLSGSI